MSVSLDEICAVIATLLGLRSVGENDRIVEDLGAESADLVNIVTALEARYGVFIDDSELEDLRTAADVYRRIQRAI